MNERGAKPGESIFVAWDFKAPALRTMLEGLVRHREPGQAEFRVLGLGPRGGEIFFDLVLPEISKADRLLAIVDSPNINVGYEIGLACALGKPVALACLMPNPPRWVDLPPLRNFAVQPVGASPEEQIRQIVCDPIWWARPQEQALCEPSEVLFLCADRGEGFSLSEEVRRRKLRWRTLPEAAFTLSNLDGILADVSDLVWVIPTIPGQPRDGDENAALAVIGGWFGGRVLAATPGTAHDKRRELTRRLVVLASPEARQFADLRLLSTQLDSDWKSLGEFAGRIDAIATRLSERLQRTDDQASKPTSEPLTAVTAQVTSVLRASAIATGILAQTLAVEAPTPRAVVEALLGSSCAKAVMALDLADTRHRIADPLSAEAPSPLRRILEILMPYCIDFRALVNKLSQSLAKNQSGEGVIDVHAATSAVLEAIVAGADQRPCVFVIGPGRQAVGAFSVSPVEAGIGPRQYVEDIVQDLSKRFDDLVADLAARLDIAAPQATPDELRARINGRLSVPLEDLQMLSASERLAEDVWGEGPFRRRAPYYLITTDPAMAAVAEKVKEAIPNLRVLRLNLDGLDRETVESHEKLAMRITGMVSR
jgi:hypothetical protein